MIKLFSFKPASMLPRGRYKATYPEDGSSSSRISENHRPYIIKLKKGQGPSVSCGNVNGVPHVLTRASILNNGVGPMKFQENMDWSGYNLGSHPQLSVEVNGKDNFLHQGVCPENANGSKGAVVYTGPDIEGEIDCAWILAWCVPGDGSPNKIHVETMPWTKFTEGGIDWKSIEISLQNSGNQCSYRDDVTGAEASAEIDKTGNFPTIAAVFDVSYV